MFFDVVVKSFSLLRRCLYFVQSDSLDDLIGMHFMRFRSLENFLISHPYHGLFPGVIVTSLV